jgi:beta-lactamase superfamily II metal-dependent hydrolase
LALATGTRLGPYEVLTPLGAGGMGEVCRAKDTKLGRDVALAAALQPGEDSDRGARSRPETSWLMPGSVVRLLVIIPLSLAMSAQQAPKSLEIYVIDVEGGESTLFVSPSGESMLVDAGWPGFEGRDASRIAAVAHQAGVQRIDHLVVTHFHADHMGGVPQLATRVPIRQVIDHGSDVQRGSSAAAAFKPYDDLRRTADSVEARPGYLIPISGFRAQVLAAGGAVLAKALPDAGAPNPFCADFKPQDVPAGQEEIRAEDARSVSLLITFGRFRTVIMGDLGWNLERDLMCPNKKVPRVDLYLVSHHGSDTSGSPALVYALKPRVAVMNNGPMKGGAVQTFQILTGSPGLADLWQNHYSIAAGPVLNRSETFIANVEPRVASEKTPTGQLTAPVHMGSASGIRISAAQDGSFTVTNTRTGYTKRYRQPS